MSSFKAVATEANRLDAAIGMNVGMECTTIRDRVWLFKGQFCPAVPVPKQGFEFPKYGMACVAKRVNEREGRRVALVCA